MNSLKTLFIVKSNTPSQNDLDPKQMTESVYPVGLCLENKTVLIVGAGQVALRKLKTLLKQPCNLVVVTTNVTDGVAEFLRPFSPKPGDDTHSIAYTIPQEFSAKSLMIEKKWYSFELIEYHQPHLVLACTDNLETNQLIVKHAQRLGIWVNNATHHHTPGDMIIGGQLDYEGMKVALFSEYQTPALTAWVKKRIQEALPDSLSKMGEALHKVRAGLKEIYPEQSERELFLKGLLDTPQWHERAQLHTTSAEDLCNWALDLASKKAQLVSPSLKIG